MTALVIQSLRSFLFGGPAMAVIIRFIFIFLIAFWVLRFFSSTVDYYWRHTIGAFFNWLGVNGDLMMKIIIGLSIAVTI